MGVAAMRLWCLQNYQEIYEDMKNCPGRPARKRPSRRSQWTEKDWEDSRAYGYGTGIKAQRSREQAIARGSGQVEPLTHPAPTT